MEYMSGREAYGRTLAEIGKNEKIVVLDADVSKATKTSYFAKKYPDRFINVGIAEQNLLGVAAGLAVDGKIAVVSTFAVFAVCKALDQIRNVICKSNLNVKIIVTHAGLTAGEDGASHQSIEDISIMRSIPNMVVIVPADGNEATNAIKQAVLNYSGPVYVRLSRSDSPIFTKTNDEFIIGKAKVMNDGRDLTIISSGILLANAVKARECLEGKGISTALINLATIKPVDMDTIIAFAKKTKAILTVEENTKIGGLYSAVSEVLSEIFPVPIMSISIKDKFGMSGSVEELLKHYNLTDEDIVSKSLELIKTKNRIYN